MTTPPLIEIRKKKEQKKFNKKKIIKKKYILELSLRNNPHGPLVSANFDKKFHIICHETEQKTVTETQNVNGLIIIWSDQNLVWPILYLVVYFHTKSRSYFIKTHAHILLEPIDLNITEFKTLINPFRNLTSFVSAFLIIFIDVSWLSFANYLRCLIK